LVAGIGVRVKRQRHCALSSIDGWATLRTVAGVGLEVPGEAASL
jgi:hypothetical protein